MESNEKDWNDFKIQLLKNIDKINKLTSEVNIHFKNYTIFKSQNDVFFIF